MSETPRAGFSNLLVPLAGYVAATVFAAHQVHPETASEGAYLALLACIVLLPVAALADRPDVELAVGTLGSLLLVWVFPGGAARAAAHGALLVAVVSSALARRYDRDQGRSAWRLALVGGLAVHFLFTADLLLAPRLESSLLVSLLLLPLLAGAAVATLARHHPPTALFSAAVTALVIGGGWTWTATLALLALAAGSWAARQDRAGSWRWLPLVAVAGAALPSGAALALSLLLCGACLAAGSRIAIQAGIAAVALAAAALLPAERSWAESLAVVPLLLILLPAAAFSRRERMTQLLAAAVLCVAAQRLLGGPEASTAPLALAAMSLAATGVVARLQGLWIGFLLAASALMACYPWLRPAPLTAALDLIGAAPRWPSAVSVAVVMAILVLGARLATRRAARPRALPVYLALGVLALMVLLRVPVGVRAVGALPAVLTAERPRIELDLEREAVAHSILADSYLANGGSLPRGAPVAVVRLIDGNRTTAEWTLRAGTDTGEWAARRPDVAALPGFVAPTAWLSWVTADGKLLAQRYRAETTLAEPVPALRLEVERDAGLPAAVRLAVFHLEVRPPGRSGTALPATPSAELPRPLKPAPAARSR